MSVWTFIRCGSHGKPDGVYGERYETATASSLQAASGGSAHAEFVHDEDMPEALRYRGWWGKMQLYNPDANIGNDDGNIYYADINTVFIRDIERLEAEMDAIDADIAFPRCSNRGTFNSQILRIRKGSPGAMNVWNAVKRIGFEVEQSDMEHKFVRKAAHGHHLPFADSLADSYKVHTGSFPGKARKPQDIEKVCAIFFHGRPHPLDVCNDPEAPLHDVVVENWGRHIGYV